MSGGADNICKYSRIKQDFMTVKKPEFNGLAERIVSVTFCAFGERFLSHEVAVIGVAVGGDREIRMARSMTKARRTNGTDQTRCSLKEELFLYQTEPQWPARFCVSSCGEISDYDKVLTPPGRRLPRRKFRKCRSAAQSDGFEAGR